MQPPIGMQPPKGGFQPGHYDSPPLLPYGLPQQENIQKIYKITDILLSDEIPNGTKIVDSRGKLYKKIVDSPHELSYFVQEENGEREVLHLTSDVVMETWKVLEMGVEYVSIAQAIEAWTQGKTITLHIQNNGITTTSINYNKEWDREPLHSGYFFTGKWSIPIV